MLVSKSKIADKVTDSTFVCGRNPPRSRFDPQKTSGMQLSERDEEILADVFLHGMMSRGQVERCYFSSTVRCNARMRLLFDHRFVLRHYSPYAPFGSQALYSIGPMALPLVARRLEMDLSTVKRVYRRSRTPTFIEHALAVVDLWLALRETVPGFTKPELLIELWLAEMQCRHEWEMRPTGGKWHKEAFKPDAYFRLARSRDGALFNFFLECDLGHTSARQFTGKIVTHTLYLQSGLFEGTYGCRGFQTLVVTTGKRRLANLCALAEEHGAGFFRFTTFDQVRESSILGPIWTSPGIPHLDSLVGETD